MKDHDAETERRRNSLAIGIWENEGGAPGRDSMDDHYGRRVEADRSWTVYHVFTGVPARPGGEAMIGLSRSDATRGMLSLNLRSVGRRQERECLQVAPGGAEAEGCVS